MTEPTHRARELPPRPPATLRARGRLEPDEVALLGHRLREIAAGRASARVRCDLGGVTRPDIGTVGGLAELALLSRRLGCRLELIGTRQELLELIELAGLAGLTRSGVEVVGQPEQREISLCVEEERDRGDSIA